MGTWDQPLIPTFPRMALGRVPHARPEAPPPATSSGGSFPAVGETRQLGAWFTARSRIITVMCSNLTLAVVLAAYVPREDPWPTLGLTLRTVTVAE